MQYQRRRLAADLRACRDHQFPLARPQAYLGLMACAERHQPAGADGTKWIEVVQDGVRYAHLAGDHLRGAAGNIITKSPRCAAQPEDQRKEVNR
jgi:hypothetical protein